MNADLLAITNMSIGTSAGPSPLRSAVTEDTKPFSLNLTDNLEVLTPYNNVTKSAKSDPASSQSSDFSDTFCQKAGWQTPPNEGEDKIKAETEGSTCHRRAGQQQKGGETAANPAQFKAWPLINNPCLNKLTPFLHSNAGGLNAADKQQQGAKTAEKALVSNEKVIVAKGLIGRKGGQELMAKAVANGSQKTTTDENPATADTANCSAGQKKPVLNYSFPPVKGKSPETGQKMPISPRKSALIAEKTMDSAPFAKSADYTNIAGHRTPSGPLDRGGAKLSDNLSNESLLQKLNLTELQISTGQSKGGGSSPPKAGRFSAPASIESAAGGASSIEFGKFLTWPQAINTANPPGQVPLSDVYKSISEQIIETIHASLQRIDKQITIRLNPPELGQVFVRFQEREAEITGLLEVSKAEIRYEIEQALPQIIRTLTDHGIQIKRLDVLLTDQQEQQAKDQSASADQSLADGAFEQYRSFERESRGNTTTGEEVMNTYSYEDIPDQHDVFVTDGSINMLI
ncbi:MAG: flagellar hook-length control protein FliK [Phycisphaerae bacterium]